MTSVGLSTFLMTLATVKRLARTGDAEQRLVFRAGQNAGGQLRNRLRLVASGFIWRDKFEHDMRK